MSLFSWVQRSISSAFHPTPSPAKNFEPLPIKAINDISDLQSKISSLLLQPDDQVVLVDTFWFNSLLRFMDGGPKPVKLSSSSLLTKSKKLKKGLKPGQDYFFVYESVWKLLKDPEDETILPNIHKKLTKLAYLAQEHMKLLKTSMETERGDPTEMHLPAVVPRNEYLENPDFEVEESVHRDGISTNYSSVANTSSEGSMMGLFNFHRGKVGLENPGLFCYLNSGLQCLLSITIFVQVMLKLKQLSVLDPKPLSLLLATLIQNFFEVKNGWILKTAPLRLFVTKYFPANKQHDMPELFRFLINQIETELGSENLLTKEVFNGVLCSTIVCTECGNVSKKEEIFIDLQVELSQSVDKSLESFTKEEVLSTGYRCVSCEKDTIAVKTLGILKVPTCLSIQIKRFRQEPNPHKSTSFVKYRRKMQVRSLVGVSQYELCAVGVHIGSMYSGHYVTYGKRHRSWYCFDDTNCGKVELKRVLNQKAYMLVYILKSS